VSRPSLPARSVGCLAEGKVTLLPRSTGFEAKGDNSPYDYYINFCKCVGALRDTFHRYTR
jgi:hypothetical protein